jgi:glutaminyl-peptide cyclotransferase
MSRRAGVGIVIMSVVALTLLTLWLRRLPPPAPPRPPASPAQPAPAPAPPKPPERLKVKVLATHPHDPQAYTQGLLWHEGKLYESAGQYGASSLREVNPATGEVLRFVPVDPSIFAEGLALVGDRLIQLSWKEDKAFVYGLAKLDPRGTFDYTGEGWGLCYDGKKLIMSDGSDRLTFRDPNTFTPVGGVNVSDDSGPVLNLNELECVDGAVYANVWQTDRILRIDPESGRVAAEIDASGLLGLLSSAERAKAEVLNGIAWRPDTKTFYITGKYWPKMFEVQFVPTSAPTP